MGIDPHEYLRDVLRRVPEMKITEIGSITPAAWAKAKKTAEKKAAETSSQSRVNCHGYYG